MPNVLITPLQSFAIQETLTNIAANVYNIDCRKKNQRSKNELTTPGILTQAAAYIVLFASDKGGEIRRKISKQGKGIVDDVQGTFREGKEKFGDMKEDIMHTVKEKVRELS